MTDIDKDDLRGPAAQLTAEQREQDCAEQFEQETSADQISRAMADLPLAESLRFVANIIFGHGGNQKEASHAPSLVVAYNVLDMIVDRLKRNEKAAAQLRL